MLHIRRMGNGEITRIAEIDRSEHVTLAYRVRDGQLEERHVDWHVPRWSGEENGEHSVQAKVAALSAILDQDGVMWGAFDEDRLAGVAILRPALTEDMAQLAFLHVSNGYRRQGIATRLTEQASKVASEMGAQRLYVSATESESAVGFYRSQGFELAKEVYPELYALEPEDIHMVKILAPT
jgi:ribosomal protein S18 acetylase RimI-like enzyme